MATITSLFERTQPQERRIALDVPVALVHETGTVAAASGLDISVSGLHVVCSQLTLDSLYRSDVPLMEDVSYLDAHFMLPLFSLDPKVDVRCRLSYQERRAPGEFLLGLEFLQLWGDSRRLLTQFLGEPPHC